MSSFSSAVGTTLQVKRNGSNLYSITDASIASGNAGINFSGGGAGPDPQLDDWTGVDVGAAGPTAAQEAGIWAAMASSGVIGRVDA